MVESVDSESIMLYLTIGAIILLILMIVVIRVGLKGSQGGDLMDVPPPEELLDKAAAGERISILPERPDLVVDVVPSVLNPARPKDDAVVGGINGVEIPASEAPAPQIGDNETESGYSEDQLMEREIKAMLLQGRMDRAVEHVMQVKKISMDEAEAIVTKYS